MHAILLLASIKASIMTAAAVGVAILMQYFVSPVSYQLASHSHCYLALRCLFASQQLLCDS